MVKPGSLLALLAVGLFVAWFLFLRPPAFLGGPTSYVRVSGVSMEPSLREGDLAVVRKQGSYSPGDVVAFRVPKGEPGDGAIVIHRIVGGSAEDGFIMQGDNKENPDLWRPTQDDIVGGMWFSVPLAGRLLAFLQSPLLSAGLASGFAVFLVLSGDAEEKRPRKGSPGKAPQCRPAPLATPWSHPVAAGGCGVDGSTVGEGGIHVAHVAGYRRGGVNRRECCSRLGCQVDGQWRYAPGLHVSRGPGARGRHHRHRPR